MKLKSLALLHHSSLHSESAPHSVRVIKAGKMPEADRKESAGANGAARVHENSTVRIVESGADYCDLELVCGCGDVTRFRCWNVPAKEEKGAV